MAKKILDAKGDQVPAILYNEPIDLGSAS